MCVTTLKNEQVKQEPNMGVLEFGVRLDGVSCCFELWLRCLGDYSILIMCNLFFTILLAILIQHSDCVFSPCRCSQGILEFSMCRPKLRQREQILQRHQLNKEHNYYIIAKCKASCYCSL